MIGEQLRAVCPVCFRAQALEDGRLVNHGFRRPRGWHQNVNRCGGTHKAHFGTEAGRDVTRATIAALRAEAERLRTVRAPGLLDGSVTAFGKDGLPAPHLAVRQAAAARQEAAALEADATQLEAFVAVWEPREPARVRVDRRAAPLVHFRRPNWGTHCAGSRMGAHRGRCTSDRADVTCEKCLARLARAAGGVQ